jgi:predicted NBD/HSP70 family sugar kinase
VNRDPSGQRSETVRRGNLSAIARQLHDRGPLSRSELVARTGLTRSAIRELVGDLVGGQLVDEVAPAPIGVPGRPSALVRPDPHAVTVLALEIAIDSLAAALVGLGGDVIDEIRVERHPAHTTPGQIVADLVELTHSLPGFEEHRDALLGIGVAIAGVVRRPDGFVRIAPNLNWREVALGEQLAAALDLGVPLDVANEADLGALAELRRGAARGADIVVYVFGEVGVGGGIIIGGELLSGAAGYAGEIGHMPLNPAGRACRCGSIGCWETEIGEGTLLRLAGRPENGGRAEVDAVIAEASSGAPLAMAAMAHVGRWLGIGAATLINTLNPRVIVLGGLFERAYPFISGPLLRELEARSLEAPRRLVRVVAGTLGDDAPLLGAAELAFEPFLADPAAWLGPRELAAAGA